MMMMNLPLLLRWCHGDGLELYVFNLFLIFYLMVTFCFLLV